MYLSDSPINNTEDDLLGRATFSENLAKAILDNRSLDTLCLGLFGKWGCGKTSIINMTINEIERKSKDLSEDKKLIVLKFNPWDISSAEQLMGQFFRQLANKFQSPKNKKMSDIGDAIEKYSSAIELAKYIPGIGETTSKLGKCFFEKLGKHLKNKDLANEGNILLQKDKVIELLKNLENKVLIVIDDIDRLSNEQIRLIFQLVNSVAKFPNIIYLLSFDRDIVVNALEKIQDGDGNEYLEKIIQVPIVVPELKKDKLKNILFNRLNDIILQFESVSFNNEYWQRVYRNCVYPFINSIRDVNRLCNTLMFKLPSIYREVNFSDLVAITVIEISKPMLYNWIVEHKADLVGEDFQLALKQYKKSNKELLNYYKESIHDLISNSNLSDPDLNDSIDKIITMLSEIFPYFAKKIGENSFVYNLNSLRRNKNIGHYDKFDIYFSLEINDDALNSSIIEDVVFRMPSHELITYMLKLNINKSLYFLLKELNSAISEMPNNRKYIFIEVLFNTSILFEGNDVNRVLSLDASEYAEYIIRLLLDSINQDERYNIIKNVIQNADVNCFDQFSYFLNITELAHGRLTAGNEERNYEKLVTIEQLEEIEKIYCNRAEILMKSYNMLDFKNARLIIYLLENLNSEYIVHYFNKSYFTTINAIKFLALSINMWRGVGIDWEIGNDYSKYISESFILESINKLLTDKTFFKLDKDIQNRATAFYLYKNGKVNKLDTISQSEVEKQLIKWQER